MKRKTIRTTRDGKKKPNGNPWKECQSEGEEDRGDARFNCTGRSRADAVIGDARGNLEKPLSEARSFHSKNKEEKKRGKN